MGLYPHSDFPSEDSTGGKYRFVSFRSPGIEVFSDCGFFNYDGGPGKDGWDGFLDQAKANLKSWSP
jgi:hypothetical protein